MIPGWDKIVSKAARQLYDGKLKGGLSDEMITNHANYLWNGMQTGFDAKGLAHIDEAQMKALRENIFYFSGYKNLQQMKEATALLTGKDGQVVSRSEFKKAFMAIDATYNTKYLDAEYDFATNAAQSIGFWHTAQAEKDALPYLRWSAVHDARTRPEHMALDNICLPVDHPFWKTHWIPYGWLCRCLITQEGPGATVTHPDRLKELKDPLPYFQYNPGADNVVFPVDKDRFKSVHPYAENTTAQSYEKVKDRVSDILNALPEEKAEEAAETFTTIKGKNGGYVKISSKHNPDELEVNTKISKGLANNGEKVIMPAYDNTYKVKNPDAIIGTQKADFKYPKTAVSQNTIQKHFHHAHKQGATIAVVYIDNPGLTASVIRKSITATYQLDLYVNLKEIWLLNAEDVLIKYSRGGAVDFKLLSLLGLE